MAIKHGTGGADTLVGTSGADQLFGEAGNDTLKGLAGPDTLDGGSGTDTADYSASAAVVGVVLDDGGFGNTSDAFGDVYVSVENVVGSAGGDGLFGDGVANRLEGGRGNDFLGGKGGNDSLLGGGGNDAIEGGAGADLLNGGGGANDTLDYRGSVLGVNVNLSNGQVSGGDAAGDRISGFEDLLGSAGGDVLAGTLGVNQIQGLAGADQLFGFAGDDGLIGGAGVDTMTGGDGADLFFYNFASESPAERARDVILDFSHAQGDRIGLGAIDANAADAVNDSFLFLGLGPTIDGPGQIEYFFEGSNTVVRINTAGDLAPEMEIQLSGQIDLVASDFIL